MTLTADEKRTIRAVFSELLKMGYPKLNTILGSETIKGMQELYYKLKYEDFCTRRGIRFEDMTDEDFEDAELEGYEL